MLILHITIESLPLQNETELSEIISSCTLCGNTTISQSHLDVHIETQPTNQLLCAECDKRLESEKHLNGHQTLLHSPHFIKSYNCDFCKQNFSRKERLDDHIGVHHASDFLTCNFCK